MRFLTTVSFLSLMTVGGCKKSDNTVPATSTPATCNGTISGTLNGIAFTRSDDVGATFVGGQFMGIASGNLDAKVGDSEAMPPTPNTTKARCHGFFRLNGKTYGTSTGVAITITAYDGTQLTGTFTGSVSESSGAPAVPVRGTFTTTCLTKI